MKTTNNIHLLGFHSKIYGYSTSAFEAVASGLTEHITSETPLKKIHAEIGVEIIYDSKSTLQKIIKDIKNIESKTACLDEKVNIYFLYDLILTKFLAKNESMFVDINIYYYSLKKGRKPVTDILQLKDENIKPLNKNIVLDHYTSIAQEVNRILFSLRD